MITESHADESLPFHYHLNSNQFFHHRIYLFFNVNENNLIMGASSSSHKEPTAKLIETRRRPITPFEKVYCKLHNIDTLVTGVQIIEPDGNVIKIA